MLLFQKRFHQGLVDGSITLTFRRWAKPHVKPGGRYRVHPIGVVMVDALEVVADHELTETDAVACGFASLDEMKAYLRPGPEPLFKVTLHHAGDGDRVEHATDAKLDPAALAELTKRVARLERDGKWVKRVMLLIDRHPRVAASQLAKKLARETLPFKVDVRKLKKLGLTMSFEVGYELSPRGRAFLKRWASVKRSGKAAAR
ncbi:MAG: hypothetical protein IPJ65_35295 [Archangiaceae bacterium]|nr:hypothetical protein [Archangiaceae bacterium]